MFRGDLPQPMFRGDLPQPMFRGDLLQPTFRGDLLQPMLWGDTLLVMGRREDQQRIELLLALQVDLLPAGCATIYTIQACKALTMSLKWIWRRQKWRGSRYVLFDFVQLASSRRYVLCRPLWQAHHREAGLESLLRETRPGHHPGIHEMPLRLDQVPTHVRPPPHQL